MLIECEECGNSVSTNAESCPNCGNPIKLKAFNDVIEVLGYVLYIPLRYYQRIYFNTLNEVEEKKSIKKKKLDFSDILTGLILLVLLSLFLNLFISGSLSSDDSFIEDITPIHLTKYEKRLSLPLYWEIFPYTLLLLHALGLGKIYWDYIFNNYGPKWSDLSDLEKTIQLIFIAICVIIGIVYLVIYTIYLFQIYL